MSGLGPAACWLAHKRLESWSRMAKERVGAVRKASSETSEDKTSSTEQLVVASTTASVLQNSSSNSYSLANTFSTDSNSSIEVTIREFIKFSLKYKKDLKYMKDT